jgi:hypothetical protein
LPLNIGRFPTAADQRTVLGDAIGTSGSVPDTERPDYGIDAPGVVRNLGIAGVSALLVAVASLFGFIPREFGWRGASGGGVRIAITPSAIPAGVALCAAACWMYFGSKYGKTAERDKLIGRIEWTGDESRVRDEGPLRVGRLGRPRPAHR